MLTAAATQLYNTAITRGASLIKGFSKHVGFVAAGPYVWDLYNDSTYYQGGDFNKAAAVSTLAFWAGVGVGLALVGAPVLVAVTVGVIASTAIGFGANYLKKQWIGY